jgi:DNA-binding MarR family transcriptional regulator
MPKKYIVRLTSDERAYLLDLTQNGRAAAKQLTHARILLKADTTPDVGGWSDESIHAALDASVATIERVRRIYVTHGLASVLHRKARTRERRRQLDGVGEAHLIALTCSAAPPGHAHWTLRLLADRMVALGYVEQLSHETVRQTLKKTHSSRG